MALRNPSLDGVRGVAILIVVSGHLYGSVTPYGAKVGVTLFFVLSGYLITGLLAGEQKSHNRIDLKAFYIRRLLRLYPALLLLLLTLPAILWAVGDNYLDGYWKRAGFVALYLSDFVQASGTDYTSLNHTWSLAVEEQFYLVWPIALLGLISASRRSPERLQTYVAILVGLSVAWRLVAMLQFDWHRTYYGPDTNFFALGFGCLLAVAPRLVAVLARLWLPAAFALVALCGLRLDNDSNFANWVVFAAAVAATAIVSRGALGHSWFELQPLRWFGTVSYGLYLWHVPLLQLGPGDTVPDGLARLLIVAAAVVIAWLSFELVEKRALAFKRRWDKSDDRTPAG